MEILILSSNMNNLLFHPETLKYWVDVQWGQSYGVDVLHPIVSYWFG